MYTTLKCLGKHVIQTNPSVASDVLTTICHLSIVNVCVIIILSVGYIQISILLLCFLYLFVELMIDCAE